MFTGIIEEVGKITGIRSSGDNVFLDVSALIITEDIALGKSISINGVCLTVVSFKSGIFTVEATKITMDATNLGGLKQGSVVNLERAMRANGRFDGHFVQGHVDGTGIIRSIKKTSSAAALEIQTAENLLGFMVEKGSVAVNGISLTIVKLNKNGFVVNIIPHTSKVTALHSANPGELVNIEADMLAKYIIKGKECKKTITEEFLKQNGF
ncbi:MAG: riboflavin synthase [Candidatus Firestonebacteria bacterium]